MITNHSSLFAASILYTAVLRGKVALPCDVTAPTPDDSVALILWYKDDALAPIYTLDARKGEFGAFFQRDPFATISELSFSSSKKFGVKTFAYHARMISLKSNGSLAKILPDRSFFFGPFAIRESESFKIEKLMH